VRRAREKIESLGVNDLVFGKEFRDVARLGGGVAG
jgi:hypothetical protein